MMQSHCEENLYQQLFEATPHPYLILNADPDFTIVAVNDKYLHATRTKRDAIVGHGLFEIFPDNPNDDAGGSVSDLRISLNRVLLDRCADIMGVQKYDIPLRDGSNGFAVKYWSPINTPVFNRQGDIAFIIHHVEDVTEFILSHELAQKNNAEQLGKVEQRAERMEAEVMRRATEVKEANRALKNARNELARLNERLSELDRLKSEFFANVSHELRTPLALIIGPLERRLDQDDLSPQQRRENEMMVRNARLLYRHVCDLLDAAKFESGHMTVECSRFDLIELARICVSQFESLANDRGIAVQVELPGMLEIEADSGKIQRILLNLLANAFKFAPEGGEVTLSVRQEDKQGVLEVQDNGPGVPVECRAMIFERFSQIESGPQRRFGGTGLGLSIVRQFVKLHDGTVEVVDAPGGGALFTVRLPLVAPAGTFLHSTPNRLDPLLTPFHKGNRQVATIDNTQDSSSGKALILVVEDNPDMNEFITASLRPWYRVVSAFNGQDGLDKALTHLPDLIVSDVMMPVMSGDGMIEALRRHREMQDIPVIMLTAKADDQLRLKSLKAGVQEFLTKPFNTSELLARIEGLLVNSKRSVEHLQQSEARYRSLFENTLNSIARCHLIFQNGLPVDYVYVDVNPAFEKMTGLKEIRGKKISDIDPRYCLENPEVLRNFGHVATTGQPMRWEQYIASKAMWLRYAVYSPGTDEVAVVTEDITDRKRAEIALAQSEQKYRTLADSGQALIWTSGLDKKCDYFNKSWLAFTGRTLAQELGDGWVEGVHPDDVAHCLHIYCSAFDHHERFSMEYRLRHASGSYRWLQDDGTPRFDGEGNFLGYIGHCLDITERKRAEEEREKLQSQLNQAQKMESVGRLAGGVAHDFNNILSVIIGYTELAMESVDPALPLHSDLEKIFEAAMRSTNIVRQLLAFSRKQAIAPIVLDLHQTVEGMLNMLRRLIGENIALNWMPTPAFPIIKMDPSQVDQILANLCVNARDAIENIGKITIETKVVSVGEEYCADHFEVIPGNYAILIVSDNGKGMEKDVVDKIFEPFFTTKGNSGTGLGLSTVYGIAQQNNGFVNVYSEPNRGTTFKVYLPIHTDEAVQNDVGKSQKIEMSKGETILFVEDDMALLEMGRTMLKKLGYEVLSTNSPTEALRLAAECIGTIDLLMTDVIMPEMNGKELSTQLLRKYPHIKILFLSGYTANVIAHHGIIDEGIHFLQKPFSRKDLSHKIREVLGQQS